MSTPAESVWDNCPIVTVTRPGCPNCLGERYVPIKGTASSDGSRTSRRICQRCSRRYIVISEPPDSGKSSLDTR